MMCSLLFAEVSELLPEFALPLFVLFVPAVRFPHAPLAFPFPAPSVDARGEETLVLRECHIVRV